MPYFHYLVGIVTCQRYDSIDFVYDGIQYLIILFFILSLDLHIPYFSFQSYFMGCSFDSFSNSWLDKSYILTLMVLCWLAPTTMNLVCYVAILSRVRASDFEISRVTRRLNSCHSRFHYRNKVKHIDTHFLYFQEILGRNMALIYYLFSHFYDG